MNSSAYWKYLVMQCVTAAALIIIDANNIQVSRNFTFFALIAAPVFINSRDSASTRAPAILIQLPFMAFLEKFHFFSADRDILPRLIYCCCPVITIFLIERLRLNNPLNLAIFLVTITAYSAALAKIEIELLVLPAVFLNLVFLVILSRTSFLLKKER